MKSLLIIFLCFMAYSAIGQDTTYYDSDNNIVESLSNSSYYEIMDWDWDKADSNKARQRVYFKSGQIKSEMQYISFKKRKLHGIRRMWFETGKISKEVGYENGKLHGHLLTFWENGKPKRKDFYENGVLVRGKCWNPEGEEVPHFRYEVMPEFPEGLQGIIRYLGKNIVYPKKSRKDKVQGIVLLNFFIEKDGSVSHVKILESVNDELDAEALRVVKAMPNWKAGIEDGETVRVSFTMPLNFKVN